tara:strand:+ start:4980 stop:6128 length:1149 start_codon:yes stop_codon:yes gene_type:complete
MKNHLNGEPEMKDHFYINKPNNILPDGLTDSIFRNSDSLQFHKSLENYHPTPILELKELAKSFEVGKIFINDESFRFGLNAFKGLGASYAIQKILEKDPSIQTFCTATDGNHGRAVAWSAKMLGKAARVYVPKDTTQARIKAIENEGAIVKKIEGNYEETCAVAQKMSEANNWQLVQDAATDNYEEIPAYIKAGYLTHFIELEESLHSLPEAQIDIVFIQAGVGSWPASAAWYYLNRYRKKRPKLVLVEPKEAAGILASLQKGERTSPDGNYKTIMAGLNCGIPSTSAWEILRNSVDAAMAIEDDFTEKAMRKLYFPEGTDERIVSGESGAAGFAGFLALMTDPKFQKLKEYLKITSETRFLFYSTEGDTDPENFNKIIGKN